MVESQTVRVVGAIIERDGAVFAARRNSDRSAGGFWEFPGGKVEVDETPEDALRRELLEELSVEISVGPFVGRSLSTVSEKSIELSCYLATLIGPDPLSSTDHDALRWVSLDELHHIEWAPGDIPIVSVLASLLRDIRSGEGFSIDS